MDALVAVKARIASALFAREHAVAPALGAITLHPHQVEAVQRILRALATDGGALLADAPGMGKTFVALAVARRHDDVLVAAPAALRAQWLDAARRTQVPITFVSLEALARRPVCARPRGLLIVDEAHHVRNSATARYARVAALAIGRRVLLLSATPVHNTRRDLDALLALFSGERAAAMPAGALARLAVRREGDVTLMPRIGTAHTLRVSVPTGLLATLRTLPPPLPASDGRAATALVRQGLLHALSSSVAALAEATRRAWHRAAALDDALAAGRWPTRRELTAWTVGDDSSQLTFAELLAPAPGADFAAARAMLAAHRAGLRAVREAARQALKTDTHRRVTLLRRVLARHPGEVVMAFSWSAATITALWHALRQDAGVVAITAARARSAGSGLTRADVLAALRSDDPLSAQAPLRLVLSTDVLGEGVDLRRASVVVHLDQPWTPARLTQRVGRAARLGARHARVAVWAIAPPRPVERLLGLTGRHTFKEQAMHDGTAPATARERLLQLVRPWLRDDMPPAAVATAAGMIAGWVAVVRDEDGACLLLGAHGGDMATDDDEVLFRLLSTVSLAEAGVAEDAAAERDARRAIGAWLANRASARLAGHDLISHPARRRVLALLDQALRTASLSSRRALHDRAQAVRAALRAARGAGIDRALAGVMDRSYTAGELLTRLEDILPHTERAASSGTPRVEALLLLRPSPAVNRPITSARSAASPETAATR